MTSENVADIVRSNLSEELQNKPGAVLSTGADTLKKGRVYIMGFNPGGDPETIAEPIVRLIAPADGTSAYTHDCWQPKCTEPQPCSHLDARGATRPECLVRHQRNMIALTGALGATPATIFSANAVFARSTRVATLFDQTGFNLYDWWNACWPVHQRFLAVVRPQLIVTLGYGENSSAFGLLRGKCSYPKVAPLVNDGRRSGRWFAASIPLLDGTSLETIVAGAPHPSYFAPGPLLTDRLAELSR